MTYSVAVPPTPLAPPALQHALGALLPGARLALTRPPLCPELQLTLLNADYPQHALDAGTIRRVMEEPLYWVFCWASGQVLARYLLDHPAQVAGRRVLDFGCGSGVVAIAAALAGAAEVVACDCDRLALAATAANARLNGVALTLADDVCAVDGPLDLIVVADVLYDRANLHWLTQFIERAPRVLVGDSRVKDFALPPYRQIARATASTVPDLDESAEFRDVRLYLAQRSAGRDANGLARPGSGGRV